MAIVTFDYALWSARYPELAGSVNEALAGLYFNEATLYLNNTDCSPVCDVGQRAVLLNMLVAHIALLNATINGQAPSGLVGRVKEAAEGTVRVSVDAGAASNSEAWYAQTTYGWAFWNATRGLRTMHYIADAGRSFEPRWPWRMSQWG